MHVASKHAHGCLVGRRQRQVCRSDRRSTIPIAHTSKGPMQHHPSAVVGPAATSEVPGPRGDVPSPGLLQSLPLNGVFFSIFSGTARLLHSLALPPPAGHPAHPTAEVNLLGQATSCLRLCQTSSTGGKNLSLGPAGSQPQALPMQENKPGLQDGDRRAQHAPLLDPA